MTEPRKQWTLGEFSDRLFALREAGAPLETEVVIQDGGHPLQFCSWRGDYRQLSIDHWCDSDDPEYVEHMAAKAGRTDLAGWLKECEWAEEGHEFEGYRGGEYVMGRGTPVWVAQAHSSLGRMLTGAKFVDGRIVIQTHTLELDEYDDSPLKADAGYAHKLNIARWLRKLMDDRPSYFWERHMSESQMDRIGKCAEELNKVAEELIKEIDGDEEEVAACR